MFGKPPQLSLILRIIFLIWDPKILNAVGFIQTSSRKDLGGALVLPIREGGSMCPPEQLGAFPEIQH